MEMFLLVAVPFFLGVVLGGLIIGFIVSECSDREWQQAAVAHGAATFQVSADGYDSTTFVWHDDVKLPPRAS